MLLGVGSMLGFFLHLIAIYSENTEFFPRCEDSVIKAYFLLSEGSQCYRKGQKKSQERHLGYSGLRSR